MIDAYEQMIPEYISKEDFFRFAVEKTIYIADSKIKEEWTSLKKKINANKPIFMRGMKNSVDNQLFFDFYDNIFGNKQVKKDPSNTQNPAKIMESLSGYKKSKDLKNYQLTPLFGRSKNILTFCAPWNMAYIPSILDPLLSNEAKGDLAKEFQAFFFQHNIEKFKPFVDEYNEMVTNPHFIRKIDDHFHTLYDNVYYDNEIVMKFEPIFREEMSAII